MITCKLTYCLSSQWLKSLSRLLLIAVLLSSCVKIDTPPALEVTVLDQYNNPVRGAVIGLFSSYDEWSMLSNPVQAWKETNDQGKVTFLRLQPLIYYIYVEKDSLNNLMNEIETVNVLKENVIAELEIHIE